jgi:uncharacterized protein YjbI with pentapeptide repeats
MNMKNYNLIDINGTQLTDQEKFVLEQVENGDIADLVLQYGPDYRFRKIRAKFLEKLLIDEFEDITINKKRIQIVNAIIIGSLDLVSAEVSYLVLLGGCIFLENVIFHDAYFKKHLFLSGSFFIEDADFHRIRVDGNLFIRDAIFYGLVNLSGAHINRIFDANRAKFLGDEANFNSMTINDNAFFRGTFFNPTLDLSHTKIKGNLDFGPEKTNDKLQCSIFEKSATFFKAKIQKNFSGDLVQFIGTTSKGDFHGVEVEEDFVFRGAIFQGPVDFSFLKIKGSFAIENYNEYNTIQKTLFANMFDLSGSRIGKNLIGDYSRFSSKDSIPNFLGLKVEQTFSFVNAIFWGGAEFGYLEIGKQIILEQTIFLNRSKGVGFNSTKIVDSAFLNKAVFLGDVDFSFMRIGRQFNLDGSKFLNETALIKFNNIIIGDMISLIDSFFLHKVDLNYAVIKNRLNIMNAIFLNKEELSLNNISIKGDLICIDNIYNGGLSFTYANLHNFILRGKCHLSKCNFQGARIHGVFRIEGVIIDKFEASYFEVEGPSCFKKVRYENVVDLRDSSFQQLYLIDITWPKNRDAVWMDGLTYMAISTKEDQEEAEDWRKTLALLDNSRFNMQNYLQLESYFRRCGFEKRANKIFITGKRRNWRQREWWSLGKWFTLIFWDCLAGYGRKPWQILYLIVPLVALGAWLFPPEFASIFLESHKYINEMILSYPWLIKIFLSMDRFLPGVDLGLAKDWQPANICLLTWLYWYVLKIFGWITIPIALAAIYTRIK